MMFQFISILILLIVTGTESKKYNPDWNSLDSRPIPTWYDNAKIGIFVHWGVYSVPSMGTEWFWINWKGQKVPKYVEFMEKNYKPGFTYQEFASDFTAEQFNATEWALLFQESGAKYVVVTSKHHDGYTLWPSSRSFSWNSLDVGPKKDLIGELASTIRQKTKLTFGLYYSLFEWFNRMYLEDKANNFQNNTYVTEKVWPEIKDIIERFHPEVLWSDGDWETVPEYWNSEELIAWLYNESPVRDTVVTNDRWGSGTLCKHGDFYTCQDRFNPGVLKTHKWENAFTIDKTSWGHRFDTSLKDYMTSKEIIKEIVTTISCNGNVLVNVGPTKYGTITPIFEERLRDMGYWLKMNGEAIYSSSYWTAQNDTLTPNVWYTMRENSNDSERIFVYAMILDYPYKTNAITLKSLHDKVDSSSKARLLGMPEDYYVKFDKIESGILFKLPPKNIIDFYGLKLAWTLKIDIPK